MRRVAIRQPSGAPTATLRGSARFLAEAGLEDARIKLEKDGTFPPLADPAQTLFTYSESLTDIAGTTELGRYSVTVDISRRAQNGIIAIRSEGSLSQSPSYRRVLYAELDLSGDLSTNPNYFRYLHIEDRGGQ